MKATGIILLVVGVLLTAFTSFNFFTKEKVVDVGKLEINKDKKHHVNWSPWVGVALMGGGVLFLVFGAKKGN